MTKPRLRIGSKLFILILALASVAVLIAATSPAPQQPKPDRRTAPAAPASARMPADPSSTLKAQTASASAAQADPAKNPYAPDIAEPGSVEAIAKFTTEPRFGNPWVAYLPDSATVPSPAEYLGHAVGAAGELTSTSKIYGYFR